MMPIEGRPGPCPRGLHVIVCDGALASRLCADTAREWSRRFGACEALQGLELALSELLSNLVRHGRGVDRIGLRWRGGAAGVRLTLVDDGLPFDMASLPARLPDEPDATGGRGLWLAHRTTRDFRGRRHRGWNVHGLATGPLAAAPTGVAARGPHPAD